MAHAGHVAVASRTRTWARASSTSSAPRSRGARASARGHLARGRQRLAPGLLGARRARRTPRRPGRRSAARRCGSSERWNSTRRTSVPAMSISTVTASLSSPGPQRAGARSTAPRAASARPRRARRRWCRGGRPRCRSRRPGARRRTRRRCAPTGGRSRRRALGRDRVVEVPGVVGVDGEGGQLAQVHARGVVAGRAPASAASSSTRRGNERRSPRSSISPSTTSRATSGRPSVRTTRAPRLPAPTSTRSPSRAAACPSSATRWPPRPEQRLGNQEAAPLAQHADHREVEPRRAPCARTLTSWPSRPGSSARWAAPRRARSRGRRRPCTVGLHALLADVLAARAGSTRPR